MRYFRYLFSFAFFIVYEHEYGKFALFAKDRGEKKNKEDKECNKNGNLKWCGQIESTVVDINNSFKDKMKEKTMTEIRRKRRRRRQKIIKSTVDRICSSFRKPL